jgi:hypothetical protein
MVMDLEETGARNDCAGEGQRQFNRRLSRQLEQRVSCETVPSQ